MKNIPSILLLLLLYGNLFAMGNKPPQGVSLLLVPAKPAMVQLGRDMANQRHALLMTYANTSSDELFIHIWNGAKWLKVPQNAFETGGFIKNSASRLLVVGEESDLTASLIEKALVWSPEVLHLGTTDITELLNQMGRLYDFNRKDWEWIATRYELDLEDLNSDQVATSWYDDNKASDLPPSEKPWKKNKAQVSEDLPETSLTPLMPPLSVEEPVVLREEFLLTEEPEVKAEVEPEVEPEIEAEVMESPKKRLSTPVIESGDFSLEIE